MKFKQTANDACISIGKFQYVDITFNYRGIWRLSVKGVRIGYFRTKRLAKKAWRKIEKEQTVYKGGDPELLKKYQSGDFVVYWEHPRGGLRLIPPWEAPISNSRVSCDSYIFTVKKKC